VRCPSNAQIRRGAKEWYEDHADDYWEAKAEAFREFLTEESSGMTYAEMDDEWYNGLLDSFTFPDQDEWLSNEYESFIGDMADQCYDSFRDEQMFKDE
jgi:hypothetical protein